MVEFFRLISFDIYLGLEGLGVCKSFQGNHKFSFKCQFSLDFGMIFASGMSIFKPQPQYLLTKHYAEIITI